MIQGIQSRADHHTTGHPAAVYSVLNGFGEQDVQVTEADSERLAGAAGPSTKIQFGGATSFAEAGRRLAGSLTLSGRRSISVQLVCKQLDQIRFRRAGDFPAALVCRRRGRTGKSRVIEAAAAPFAGKGIGHRLLVTATSGTAAAQIEGVTIHSACSFSKDGIRRGPNKTEDGTRRSSAADLRVDGQIRMDWQEKYLPIIDEVSMLGARTVYAVNEQDPAELSILFQRTIDFLGTVAHRTGAVAIDRGLLIGLREKLNLLPPVTPPGPNSSSLSTDSNP